MHGLEFEDKEEEEPKTITLDEWKAMQVKNVLPYIFFECTRLTINLRKIILIIFFILYQQPKPSPSFNIRQPNEGEDPTKWKNLVLKKKENLDDSDEVIYEEEDIWVPQRAGRQKLITGKKLANYLLSKCRILLFKSIANINYE